MSAENGERVSFRKLLLNRCQEEFQKENVDTTLIEGMQREIDEATSDDVKKEKKELMEFTIAKNKRRSLGNIRLVALACQRECKHDLWTMYSGNSTCRVRRV